MAGTCIRLMMVALCFSYLIRTNGAIPVTRSSNLVQKPDHTSEASKPVLMENPDDQIESMEMESPKRRIDIEVNDYPGSGANNRHTPRAQQARGCNDC